MTRSKYQTRECPDCGAQILCDETKPIPSDPNDHEDDCPSADAWEGEAE